MYLMKELSSKHFHYERYLYFFIVAHLIAWTLVPALVRYNLPLDSIEGTVWGHQLEWGYDKNPFLNAWLTALATHFTQSGWMVYFFSQLSVVAAFWAVWQLTKNMLPAAYALVSVMILEAIQYFNFHAIDFNDNTLELGLWALTIYFFYQALSTQKKFAWILTGIFAAFGMMAKYYTSALLAAMFLFLLSRPENRKQLTTSSPYFGIGIFFIIILPHVIWLFFHNFITITYVFERTSSEPNWTNHFFFPAQFAWQQIEVFLPALLLFLILFIGKTQTAQTEQITLSSYNRAFLIYVGLVPFLLTLLLSLFLGIKLRAGWGMPLLTFWGALLFTFIDPKLTRRKLYCFFSLIFVLMFSLLISYCVSLIYPADTSSANFPGREIANAISSEWHRTYHQPLAYIGGSRWLGGNISFYSHDKPAVFMEWNKERSPWIDIQDMQKKGAVFVWDISAGETLPANVKAQFPQLQAPTTMTFSWLRNKNLPPIQMGVAILPPRS